MAFDKSNRLVKLSIDLFVAGGPGGCACLLATIIENAGAVVIVVSCLSVVTFTLSFAFSANTLSFSLVIIIIIIIIIIISATVLYTSYMPLDTNFKYSNRHNGVVINRSVRSYP